MAKKNSQDSVRNNQPEDRLYAESTELAEPIFDADHLLNDLSKVFLADYPIDIGDQWKNSLASEFHNGRDTIEGVYWVPNPGPQTDALESLADELFYGGAAGGGKTFLLIGAALTRHRKSIIFRRELRQMRDIIETSAKILDKTGATYNGSHNIWRNIPGNRLLEFGSIPLEKDMNNYQGRAHDLKGFDEITSFCLTDQALVLTQERGWISVKDVVTGYHVLSLQFNGATVWKSVAETHVFNYNGGMFRVFMEGTFDFSATPEHRVVVFGFSEGITQRAVLNLKTGTLLPIPQRNDKPSDKLTTDFIGLTDGSITQHHFEGNVYCITVPDYHNFLAMQNGKRFWSGNSENMYRFVTAWTRTELPNQRARVIATGNPPIDIDGEWVMRYWGPWLDPTHSNPARQGELRYFGVIKDKEIELENGDPIKHINPRDGHVSMIYPKSRTFIPAKVDDNPYYLATNYKSTLAGLNDKGLRDKMLHGIFSYSSGQDQNKVIPISWVKLANERYREMQERGEIDKNTLSGVAYGLDPSEGLNDPTTLAHIGENFLISIDALAGAEQDQLIEWVISKIGRNTASHPIGIDNIGVGTGIVQKLNSRGLTTVLGIRSSKSTERKTADGKLGFYNVRAAMWWLIREALDPEGEIRFALPENQYLLSELCSPSWWLVKDYKIQIEEKKVIRKRIGRSTDFADALIYAYFARILARGSKLRIF
jgi:hypothetical protein